jgi:hypothetical protein
MPNESGRPAKPDWRIPLCLQLNPPIVVKHAPMDDDQFMDWVFAEMEKLQ